MDSFGVVGLDGLVSSDTGNTGFGSSSDAELKHRLYGSGFLKRERSEDDWGSSKLSKIESMLFQHKNNSTKSCGTTFFPDGQPQPQQQMLSFSCPITEDRSSQNATFPCFQLTSAAYTRNTGHNYSGSLNRATMHGVLAGARGPFTQSQWMELEHQALIYKHMTANVPVPPNLLMPIRKALDSAAFSSFSGGLFGPNTLAWGPFHLGFSSNSDPEPGRCRRTDGKKWRCSRDAVADQKYCERHMNRGRHRSRKPVEGQSGHSADAATTAKLMPSASSSSSVLASVVGPGGGGSASNSLAITQQQQQQQLKNLQPTNSSNLSASNPLSSMFLGKEKVGGSPQDPQDTPSLSMFPSSIDMKSKDNPFLTTKQHSPYEESSSTEFGLVTSDSFLNPLQRSTSLMSRKNFGPSQNQTDQKTVSQHSLRPFMDQWPAIQSDRSAASLPELDMQSARTQLSISIPMAPSPTDFMSSTSSPNQEKTSLSPLRLSREFDPIQMGLGVGSALNEPNQRQANWIPISWENSMGGPLGEALHNPNNSSGAECKSSGALNLMTEGWDGSPRLDSSPTGVLQKTTFGSLSNSSTGSSPRAENNKTVDDLLASTLIHSS